MPAFLKQIELENFKSYRGRTTIGPLKSFTAIIGPNGCGKSNLMDAISFVMGEKSSNLRVKRFSDLVHRALIGDSLAGSTSVTAVFDLEDGSAKRFTRLVQGSSSEHRIDNEVVTSRAYLGELEHLGINVKAKNFLVYQGAVESIAMKSPKECTALLEEISNSSASKVEYERSSEEMLTAEEEANHLYRKKKEVVAESREARLNKEEAERYQRLKEEHAEKLIDLQLFKLLRNERDIDDLEKLREKKERAMETMVRRKEEAASKLREKKKEFAERGRELDKIERDVREMEANMTEKRPMFIKARERVAHARKKLDSARKALTNARRAYEAHEKDVEELEDERARVEDAKAEYEARVTGESQSQGRDVTLEEEQVREYNRLKEEAEKRSARSVQSLDSINTEQKSDQDRLDNESRKKSEVEDKLKRKGHAREEARKRVEKLEEQARSLEAALVDQKKLRSGIESEVVTLKGTINRLQRDLESISEQLGEASLDQRELSRIKRKAEFVEKIKRLYSGVYDRLINMCQPIHPRYNIAVTKVFGRNMDAIVVDTATTARHCIQYLKEYRLGPETFLPLDYIETKPLKERLRNVQEPPRVKLLYDVLNFAPNSIERAVLFATRNTLVCETPEDARKVAYKLDEGTKYDAVALDGTYFKKDGIISGGRLDLVKKAKRWDEKQISRLESRREKLTEELRDSLNKSRKDLEVNTVDSKIKGLEMRLKYTTNDLASTKKQIADLEVELESLRREFDQLGSTINHVEKTMAVRDREIRDIKQTIDDAEDDVFAGFCERIGVTNIRQYEERELRSHQERAKKRMEFDNLINRISNQLDFEKQRDAEIAGNASRWETAVRNAEERLEGALRAETDQSTEKNAYEDRVRELSSSCVKKRAEVDQAEEEIGERRREVGVIAKDLLDVEQQLISVESKIEQRRAQRHAILIQCKLEDVAIPMLRGSMADIVPIANASSTESSQSTINTEQQYEREGQIRIDYSLLPEHLMDMDVEEARKEQYKLNRTVNDLENAILKIQAPTMRAQQKLKAAREKLQKTNKEFDQLRKNARSARQRFERVKKERHDRFVACFEHVANAIDPIYKSLTRNQSAQALLSPENPEEPYLFGINYYCVAPGKRFQPMCNLSGGERTLAALALLFAIRSFKPAPFFVLDEIDAALDKTNIEKVASHIRDETSTLQTIVISLNDEFYSHADALIGICPDDDEFQRSKVLTLDLTQYPASL